MNDTEKRGWNKMALKRPRGTNDFLGDKVKLMTKLEETVRDVCKSFGINEIRTPMFEYTEFSKEV